MKSFSSEADVAHALADIAVRDAAVQAALQRYGEPPFWQRVPGFASLAQIILEQQVSLASAQAVLGRVQLACREINGSPRLDPGAVLALGAEGLGQAGVTRPKQAALLNLATACESGALSLPQLSACDDEQVFTQLTAIKGIGPWTANVYLIFALRRANAWPHHDVAVYESLRVMDNLPSRPAERYASDRASTDWQPYRAAVARLLWHMRLADTGREMKL